MGNQKEVSKTYVEKILQHTMLRGNNRYKVTSTSTSIAVLVFSDHDYAITTHKQLSDVSMIEFGPTAVKYLILEKSCPHDFNNVFIRNGVIF